MVRIEGQVKWILDLEPIIQKTWKNEAESLESYCARLLKLKDDVVLAHDAEAHLNQEFQDFDKGNTVRVKGSWTEKATIFGKKLNAVAFSVLTGNTENGKVVLRTMDQIVKDLVDSTGNQCQVFLYCMDVLRWQIGGGVDDEEAKTLNRKWETLVEKEESIAAVCFLQGMCARGLKVDEKEVVKFYLKATELDPGCLVWYHHAYRSIRRYRGENGGKLDGPSEQEAELAKTAYKLCNGEDMLSVLNYGLTLKDFLWAKRLDEKFWRDKEDVYRACLQAHEKAANLADGHLGVRFKIYLAEFLYFGSAPKEDRARGREMFLALNNGYPNHVLLLQKLGNLYRDDGIVRKARDCYKRALAHDPTLVSCTMDYLRLLKQDRWKNAYLRTKAKDEIARVLDKALSPEYVLSNKNTKMLQMEQRKLENWD